MGAEGPVYLEDRPFFTAKETAKILNLSRETVYRYLKRGWFPEAFKLSTGPQGKWRIPLSGIEAFIERKGGKKMSLRQFIRASRPGRLEDVIDVDREEKSLWYFMEKERLKREKEESEKGGEN